MMVGEAWRKMPPSARLQVERNPVVQGLLGARSAGQRGHTEFAQRMGQAGGVEHRQHTEPADGMGHGKPMEPADDLGYRKAMEHADGMGYLELYTSTAGARALLAKLSDAERRTMETIVARFANVPFDEEELVRRSAAEAAGPVLRAGLAGLCAAGIIVTVRKAWGERLHVLPYDALGAWQLALFGNADAEVSEAEAELTVSSAGSLDDDVFALLSYAAKQQLSLTQKGTIHKRHLQALQSALQLAGAEPLQRMGLSYGHADTYDAGTAAALDAALRLGLLAAAGGALRVQPARLRAWLRLPRERRGAALRAAWTARLWPSEPLAQHAAAAVQHAPRGAWLALPALAAWLAGFAGGGAGPLAELAAARWFEPLAALGWLELGRHARTGELLLRVPADADAVPVPESGRFYVQPDFELVVPPDVPAAVRWELERFAERVSSDQVHVYRLTRDSVQFGCEHGAAADEIESFLEMYGLFELPDNVRQAIRQWAGAFGRVSFARVALLRCADTELAAQLARHPKLAAHLLERVGERDFIVPASRIAELQSMLDKAGYAPRKTVSERGGHCDEAGLGDERQAEATHFPRVLEEATLTAATGASPDAAANRGAAATADGGPDPEAVFFSVDSSAQGLIYTTDPLLYYELERELPERRSPLPELNDVPAVWWKDYRAYHASTRKDMIRKAIEWQSLLKLRLDGKDLTVQPKRLLEEPEGWSLIGVESGGYGEIRFAGDDWSEMKLLVPGLNDR